MPCIGIEPVVVPGAVEAFDGLLKRHGSRDLRAVPAPAAQIAEQGFGITARMVP